MFEHWRIHSIFSITQLKFIVFEKNLFNRSRLNHSKFVHVEKNIDKIKLWKIERLFNKRQTKRRDLKYLVRWQNYDFEWDVWRNISKLENVVDFVKKYKNVVKKMILFERLFISTSFFIVDFQRLIVVINFDFSVKTSSITSITIFNVVDFVFIFIALIRKFFAKSFTTFIFVIDFKKNQQFAIIISFKSIISTNIITVNTSLIVSVSTALVRKFSTIISIIVSVIIISSITFIVFVRIQH